VIGLTRRQLGLCGAAVGLLGLKAVAQPVTPRVQLPDGSPVPALGQGSWHLAQGRHPASEEEEALRTGISLGLALIDTAELYGDGRAEEMIGHVIAGQRGKVFLVSKVLPDHATASGIRQACAGSLARLGTDYLDLYLLHWRGGASDLSVVVDTFETLRAYGRIRRWGVSNFLVADMEDLYRVRGGDGCATNQVRYNLKNRSIERNLLPWCEQHGCRLWPILRSTWEVTYFGTVRWFESPRGTKAARQRSPLPGRYGAGTSSRSRNLARRLMCGRMPLHCRCS
jgi:predicted oxidoreductase